MDPRKQDHRIDMISVHVGEDTGRGVGQRVRCCMLVVGCIDPAHHAKATYIIEIDRLEAEEAEVGKVDPIATVLVAGEVFLANCNNFLLRYRRGVAYEGRPCGAQWVVISTFLPDEEAAPRIFLQVLCVHGHIADEEDGATCRIEREGHQRTKRKSRMLAG